LEQFFEKLESGDLFFEIIDEFRLDLFGFTPHSMRISLRALTTAPPFTPVLIEIRPFCSRTHKAFLKVPRLALKFSVAPVPTVDGSGLQASFQYPVQPLGSDRPHLRRFYFALLFET
jgi:hypothetical protein